MLGRDFAGTTANIGLNGVQKAALKPNQPNLGVMFGEGLKAYDDMKKYNAYVDALTNEHPEDAAKIAMNPQAYEQMLRDNAATERDQQFKMDQLKAQYDYMAARDANQHAYSMKLQNAANELRNQQAKAEQEARIAAIEDAHNSGRMKDEDYYKAIDAAKMGDKLYEIAYGKPAGGSDFGFTPNGTPLTGNKKYDDAYMQETGKKAAQKAAAERDMEEMKPTLVNSMAKADKAAKNGNGIGLIGGFSANLGLNLAPNAGKNYADIQTANTQMNTFLRKELEATGLTGSELNSAAEAEAYRYQIKPTDSESIIRRKLQNFAQDKLGGTAFNMKTGQAVNQPVAVDYKNKYGLE